MEKVMMNKATLQSGEGACRYDPAAHYGRGNAGTRSAPPGP